MTLSFDPETLAFPFYHFIDGEPVAAAGDGGPEMRRPSDGRAYGECPVADAELVDRAVQSAKRALKTSGWGDARPRERIKAMQRWADLIEEEAVTLARLEAASSTRPVGQLIAGDIAVTAEQIRFFAEFADKEGSDVVPTDGTSFRHDHDRALWRRRRDHALELPDLHGRLEARPRACRRQCGGAEALRDDALFDTLHGGTGGQGRHAARAHQHRPRRRSDHRQRHHRPSGHRARSASPARPRPAPPSWQISRAPASSR